MRQEGSGIPELTPGHDVTLVTPFPIDKRRTRILALDAAAKVMTGLGFKKGFTSQEVRDETLWLAEAFEKYIDEGR